MQSKHKMVFSGEYKSKSLLLFLLEIHPVLIKVEKFRNYYKTL